MAARGMVGAGKLATQVGKQAAIGFSRYVEGFARSAINFGARGVNAARRTPSVLSPVRASRRRRVRPGRAGSPRAAPTAARRAARSIAASGGRGGGGGRRVVSGGTSSGGGGSGGGTGGVQDLNRQSGAAARNVGRVASTLIGVPKALQLFASALVNNSRQFVAFNGQIASALAQIEARRVGRSIEMGAARSQSTRFLVQNLDKLESALMPYADVITNTLNTLVGLFSGVAADMLDKIRTWGNWLGAINPALQQMVQYLEQMAGKNNPGGLQNINGRGFAPPVLSDLYKILDANRGMAGKQNVPQPRPPLVQQIPQKPPGVKKP